MCISNYENQLLQMFGKGGGCKYAPSAYKLLMEETTHNLFLPQWNKICGFAKVFFLRGSSPQGGSRTHTQGGGTWRGLGQPRNEKEEKPMLVSRRQPRQQVEAAEEEAGGTKRFVKG